MPARRELLRPPYWLGFGAFRDGADVEENPYSQAKQTPEYQAWFIGWVDGRIENKTRTPAREWWASKGFWYGVTMVVLGVIGALQQQLVSDYPQVASGLFAACGMLLVVLRVMEGAGRGSPVFPLRSMQGKHPQPSPPPAHRPPYGLCLPASLTKVRDGDTLEVNVGGQLTWPIRLLDCWASELDTNSGQQARDHLVKLLKGKQTQLAVWIPAPDDLRNLLGSLTFDRIPAHVFLDDSTTLSARMVRDGFATSQKRGDTCPICQKE